MKSKLEQIVKDFQEEHSADTRHLDRLHAYTHKNNRYLRNDVYVYCSLCDMTASNHSLEADGAENIEASIVFKEMLEHLSSIGHLKVIPGSSESADWHRSLLAEHSCGKPVSKQLQVVRVSQWDEPLVRAATARTTTNTTTSSPSSAAETGTGKLSMQENKQLLTYAAYAIGALFFIRVLRSAMGLYLLALPLLGSKESLSDQEVQAGTNRQGLPREAFCRHPASPPSTCI
jgi:hypothetical protein